MSSRCSSFGSVGFVELRNRPCVHMEDERGLDGHPNVLIISGVAVFLLQNPTDEAGRKYDWNPSLNSSESREGKQSEIQQRKLKYLAGWLFSMPPNLLSIQPAFDIFSICGPPTLSSKSPKKKKGKNGPTKMLLDSWAVGMSCLSILRQGINSQLSHSIHTHSTQIPDPV